MRIKEIAFICYPVSDLKRSREFYEKILGLKPTSVFEKDNMGFIEYDICETTFAIGCGSENFKPSNEGASLAFEVDDFDESIKKLKENKVKFILDAGETPVCRMAMITDPDGSKIMIHKRK